MKKLFVAVIAVLALPAQAVLAAPPGQYCATVQVAVYDYKGKPVKPGPNVTTDASCGLSKKAAMDTNELSIGLLSEEFEPSLGGIPTSNAKDTVGVAVIAWVGKEGQKPKRNGEVWVSGEFGLAADEAFDKVFEYKSRIGKIYVALESARKTRSGTPPAKDQYHELIGPK